MAAVLARVAGNRKRAAPKIGYSEQHIIKRIRNAAADSPLAPYKTVMGHWGIAPRHTADELAKALDEAGGNRRRAAASLEMSPSGLRRRVTTAATGSALATILLRLHNRRCVRFVTRKRTGTRRFRSAQNGWSRH